MRLLDWLKGSPKKVTFQEKFAKDIRRTLLHGAETIRLEYVKGPLERWLAFPIVFGPILSEVRRTYGKGIIGQDSPAARIIHGLAEGGSAQAAIHGIKDDFDTKIMNCENDEAATLALMAKMLNEYRWREIIDGSIILSHDFSELTIESRAYTFISHFMDAPHHMQHRLMKALHSAAENIAEGVAINGTFTDPFAINAVHTISAMQRLSIEYSEKNSMERSEDGNIASCAFAMTYLICSLRLGCYEHDPEGRACAEVALEMYAACKVAFDS